KVPAGTSSDLREQIASLPVAKPPILFTKVRHRVRSGETLRQIAARYRVSVASIQIANHLSAKKPVKSGTWLEIPVRRVVSPTTHRAARAPAKAPVQRGVKPVAKPGASLARSGSTPKRTTQTASQRGGPPATRTAGAARRNPTSTASSRTTRPVQSA